MSTDNRKLVETITDAATLTHLLPELAGLLRRLLKKKTFTADPSSNVMNYVKFKAVMAGSIVLKRYLENQIILPNPNVNTTINMFHHELTIDHLSMWLGSSEDRALHWYRKVKGSNPVQA